MALATALGSDEPGPAPPTRLRRRVPYPIAALPPGLKAQGELLLFCAGEHPGWHLGAWSEGAWRAAGKPELRLEPTHFALARGLANDGGRWRHAAPHRRVILSVVAVAAAAFLTLAAIGQVAYGDPLALCAPGRGGLAARAP